MAKSYEPESKLPNMIGSGTKITGNIENQRRYYTYRWRNRR